MPLTFEQRQHIKEARSRDRRKKLSLTGEAKRVWLAHQTPKEKSRFIEQDFERLAGDEIRCTTCKKVSHINSTRWYRHHENCPKRSGRPSPGPPTRPKPTRVELLKQEGWVVIGNNTLICPVCEYVSSMPSRWRHYSNCPSTLDGRKVVIANPHLNGVNATKELNAA